MYALRPLVWSAVGALVVGCSAEGVYCPGWIRPAIIVTVLDAVTGDPRAAQAAGIVQDGAYVDSLRPHTFRGDPPVMVSRAAAAERPGVYRVRLEAAGYAPWERSGVRVSQRTCGVEPETIEARLQPS